MSKSCHQPKETTNADFEIDGTILLRYRGGALSITIPEGITEIAEGAFAFNESLSYVEAADGLLTICAYAFSHCTNLKYVKLPSSVQKIGDCAFEGCSQLQCIDSYMIEGDEYEIASYYELGKNCIVIPIHTNEIGRCAFETCISIERVCMQEYIQTIGVKSFANCSELKEVYVFGDDPLYVREFAFDNCRTLSRPDLMRKKFIV